MKKREKVMLNLYYFFKAVFSSIYTVMCTFVMYIFYSFIIPTVICLIIGKVELLKSLFNMWIFIWIGVMIVTYFVYLYLQKFISKNYKKFFDDSIAYKVKLVSITPDIIVDASKKKIENIKNASMRVCGEVVVFQTSNDMYVREIATGKILPKIYIEPTATCGVYFNEDFTEKIFEKYKIKKYLQTKNTKEYAMRLSKYFECAENWYIGAKEADEFKNTLICDSIIESGRKNKVIIGGFDEIIYN